MRFIKTKRGNYSGDSTLTLIHKTSEFEYYADPEFVKTSTGWTQATLTEILTTKPLRSKYSELSKTSKSVVLVWLLAIKHHGNSISDVTDLEQCFNTIITVDETLAIEEPDLMPLDDLTDVDSLLGDYEEVSQVTTVPITPVTEVIRPVEPTFPVHDEMIIEQVDEVPAYIQPTYGEEIQLDEVAIQEVQIAKPSISEVKEELTSNADALLEFEANLPEHLLESVASLIKANVAFKVIERDDTFCIEISR